jgi:hypothetical protein
VPRSSWNRDSGSALIEAVVIGALVFLTVMTAVSAAIDIAVIGGGAQASARDAAVHAARHAGPDAAEDLAGRRSNASRIGDSMQVTVSTDIVVPHPHGLLRLGITPVAEIPLAPFRSDRG